MEWKQCVDHPDYEVSDMGAVRERGGEELEIKINKGGYAYVLLDRHPYVVHRMVAEAFLTREKPTDWLVDHKNTIRHDNRVDNLRWTDAKGNANNPITKENQRKAREKRANERGGEMYPVTGPTVAVLKEQQREQSREGRQINLADYGLSESTPLAMMTLGQLLSIMGKVQSPQEEDKSSKYIYGLRGIQTLFNVSHKTAQQYKNTWLAPACYQSGRLIMVDRDRAMQLFVQTGKKQGYNK